MLVQGLLGRTRNVGEELLLEPSTRGWGETFPLHLCLRGLTKGLWRRIHILSMKQRSVERTFRHSLYQHVEEEPLLTLFASMLRKNLCSHCLPACWGRIFAHSVCQVLRQNLCSLCLPACWGRIFAQSVYQRAKEESLLTLFASVLRKNLCSLCLPACWGRTLCLLC